MSLTVDRGDSGAGGSVSVAAGESTTATGGVVSVRSGVGASSTSGAISTAGNSAGPFKEECIGTGRYVRIVLPGSSRMLNLTEVKVFTTIRCLATMSPTAAPSKAVALRPLAALFLFNQAFDFLAVITSDSRQVSQSFYFTDVPQTLQMSQCCFTQTHTHITTL
jgi:hypothetical protein